MPYRAEIDALFYERKHDLYTGQSRYWEDRQCKNCRAIKPHSPAGRRDDGVQICMDCGQED